LASSFTSSASLYAFSCSSSPSSLLASSSISGYSSPSPSSSSPLSPCFISEA